MGGEFNVVINAIGAPTIIIKVKKGRFFWLAMNAAAEQFLGYAITDFNSAFDNFEGLPPARIIVRKELNLICQRCYRKQSPISFDFRHQKPDGTYRWSRNSMAPLFKDKEIKHLIITSHDITSLVETQQHLGDALSKTLQGYIPICSGCKMIRHEDEWQSVEQYMNNQLYYSQFTHGICPDCTEKYYSDVNI